MTVHRQKVIFDFIVDFYIPSCKIVIELDGSQHYEKENHKNDKERDLKLSSEGITVLRYTNLQIKEILKTSAKIF
jgi:very-short-patch-repair endonuclease